MKGLQKLILLAFAGILITACDSEQKADNTPAATKTIRIGFSQVTTAEPWRVLFNREMRQEAEKHTEIELVVADGQDRTEKQVADVETFIRQRMDVIMISPKESAVLTGVVEQASAADIYTQPAHPYTQALLSAIPQPDPKRKSQRIVLEGDVPSPLNPPPGCPFHTRCPQAVKQCAVDKPALEPLTPGSSHRAACHLK